MFCTLTLHVHTCAYLLSPPPPILYLGGDGRPPLLLGEIFEMHTSFCCTIRWRRVEAVFPGIEKLVPPTSNTVTCKSEFACNLTLSDLGVFMRIRRGWFWGFRPPGSIFLIIQVGKAMSENVARRLYILMANTGRKLYCKNAGAESL